MAVPTTNISMFDVYNEIHGTSYSGEDWGSEVSSFNLATLVADSNLPDKTAPHELNAFGGYAHSTRVKYWTFDSSNEYWTGSWGSSYGRNGGGMSGWGIHTTNIPLTPVTHVIRFWAKRTGPYGGFSNFLVRIGDGTQQTVPYTGTEGTWKLYEATCPSSGFSAHDISIELQGAGGDFALYFDEIEAWK